MILIAFCNKCLALFRHNPGPEVAHYFVGALGEDGVARHPEGVALQLQTAYLGDVPQGGGHEADVVVAELQGGHAGPGGDQRHVQLCDAVVCGKQNLKGGGTPETFRQSGDPGKKNFHEIYS